MNSSDPFHQKAGPTATAASLKPTGARHWVLVFAATLAVITFVDRVCMSQAKPYITADLGLSSQQMGLVFSAFGLAYALFEIPGGWLGDKIGTAQGYCCAWCSCGRSSPPPPGGRGIWPR